METLVANMTKEEFIQTMESIVERKLQELLGNAEAVALPAESHLGLGYQQKLGATGLETTLLDNVLAEVNVNYEVALAQSLPPTSDLHDPLELLIGSFRSDVPAWTEHVDYYLGQTYAQDMILSTPEEGVADV